MTDPAASRARSRTTHRTTDPTATRTTDRTTHPIQAANQPGGRAARAAGDPAADRPAGLDERITGALVGAAVGDALGGPVEGWSPDQIVRRHGGRVLGVVGPWHGDDWRTARPVAPYHKGDGHVTDDTLMTHALIRVYARVRDHLDAYAVAGHLVPDLMTNPRWIPELEAEALPLQRIFLAEKWLVARLHYGHVDPREAGVGNIVNCGAAMYMAPVGLVNAANPAAAYAEALDVAGAHQSSYGREAAGVQAAAVAAACSGAHRDRHGEGGRQGSGLHRRTGGGEDGRQVGRHVVAVLTQRPGQGDARLDVPSGPEGENDDAA
ncbi:ADP-ribosylglycohydrolase family protein, partial [Streptomyces sp. NPDC003697]